MAYELKIRSTAEDWDAVENENPIAKQMRTAKRKIGLTIQGLVRVSYCCGGTGFGKSRLITEAVHKNGGEVIRTIPDNYRDLLRAFENSGGRKPLVFEECDQLFRSVRCLNILKLATDTAGTQKIKVYTAPKRKTEDGYYRTVSLTAPVCFALNGNLSVDHEWPKECIPHIHALRSREAPLYISGAPEACWEYATYLAVRKGLLRQTEDKQQMVPVQVQNRAIQWFAQTAWQQTELSPRRLVKIAGVMMLDVAAQARAQRKGSKRQYDPHALGEDLAQFVFGEPVIDKPAPFAPTIFLPPRRAPDAITEAA